MKINKENPEQMIRDIYKTTKTPDIVKSQIDETLSFLKQQNTLSGTNYIGKRHKKSLSFKKAAIIAAAAIMGISGTVFAAERFYQIQINKEKEYQRSILISSERILPEEVTEVEIKVEYIPEGFVLTPEKGMNHNYRNPENEDVGYFVGEPVVIDEADPMSVPFVRDASSLTINGHDAVYICSTYTADTTWKNEKIYVMYEEMNRILCVGSWGRSDKNELIKMAENVSLTPTGNMISSEGLHRWSEVVDSQKIWEENDSDVIFEDAGYFSEAEEAQMTNVHRIGDKFGINSVLDDEKLTEIQLEASVTGVQTADTLSLLTKEEEIHPAWKELIGTDGKLGFDTLNYIKDGDGKNTIPEIIRTEEQSVKLVYATVEYTNPGTETVHDVWYAAALIPIVKDGKIYKIFDRADDTCDYVENENLGVRYEMYYSDVVGEHNTKNYIPEIGPGESVTIHFAWVVNEDELDKLYLSFGDTVFTEEGLKIGYVDLNL